jgi:hypothetical protein
MDNELYKKLKEIEHNLFLIAKDNGLIFNDKLGDIWIQLYAYIELRKPDNL